ncbi:MAG: hypothetical protein V1724_01225 [Chloroflexota bacterium]
MTDEAQTAPQVNPEVKRVAAQRARQRADAARWDLDVALCFFATLAVVIVLVSQAILTEIVGAVAVVGLALGWVMGWKKGKRAFRQFYDEELSKLAEQFNSAETIEVQVKKALHDRIR